MGEPCPRKDWCILVSGDVDHLHLHITPQHSCGARDQINVVTSQFEIGALFWEHDASMRDARIRTWLCGSKHIDAHEAERSWRPRGLLSFLCPSPFDVLEHLVKNIGVCSNVLLLLLHV